MCGIAGFQLKKEYKDAYKFELDSTLKLLDHRGPDDSGILNFEEDLTLLLHSRLSILDLSRFGSQPMTTNCGRYTISFNGEIYNYKTIKEKIDKESSENITYKGDSDTEVLINWFKFCMQKDNNLSNFFKHINGIYAFAMYDNENSLLTVARDEFGIKPLYYLEKEYGFFFSSEIKSLINLLNKFTAQAKKLNLNFSKYNEIDFEGIQNYTTFLYSPGPKTLFKNIKKLEPGHFFNISDGSINKTSKFYMPIKKSSKKNVFGFNYYKDKTYEYLSSAVNSQLVSDVPVGALLSGGVDSSAIVYIAKKKINNLKTFTIDFKSSKESYSSDLPYAKLVSKHLNVPLEVVEVTPEKMITNLEKMIWILDEPIADPAALNVYFISKIAREQGIKVLLSGTGGDDIFTGYRRHKALKIEKYLNWIPKNYISISRSFLNLLSKDILIMRRIDKALSGFEMENEDRLINYFKWTNREDLEELFSSELKSALKGNNPNKVIIDYLNTLGENFNQMDKMLAIEQRFFLGDHNLIYNDKMSMYAGVEIRVPFLDKDLVNLASEIPLKYKQNIFHNKFILKKAFENKLPKKVLYRSKNGFGVPLRGWLKYELKDWLNDLLSETKIKKRGFFNPSKVQKLIKSNFDGKVDASYTLFSIACIEIWCNHFLDNT